MGNLFLGGWATERVEEILWTPITNEIHYDVQMLRIEVCGASGCSVVDLPDRIDGSTEDDCVCSSADCKVGTVSYCYFSVVESGAGRIYMNTAANARKLLDTMKQVGMINFSDSSSNNDLFWFNQTATAATIDASAVMKIFFQKDTGTNGEAIEVLVDVQAVFRRSDSGLIQFGIIGDLDFLAQVQTDKFPTLLGTTLFMGKTIIFDRSRLRIGFALNKDSSCGRDATKGEIDAYGANSDPTPGIGCLRGTGSGGGCV